MELFDQATGQSHNCVTGVVERNLSQSQILKSIQEMMDYEEELRLVL